MTSDLMRTARLAMLLDDAQRVPSVPTGERQRSRLAYVRFEEHALLAPPWRPRLRTGELGPAYGPTDWSGEWRRWRESLFGGGLWDAREEYRMRASAPVPDVAYISTAAYLDRFGHELPRRELDVATLWVRSRKRPSAIATVLRLDRGQVDRLLRDFQARWSCHNERLRELAARRHA